MTLAELLKVAEENKASDVHITVGVPPLMRVHGSMMPIPNEPRLMAEDVEALVKGIMGEFQKRAFAERGEIDFSFGLAGMGRYRVNVFRQRGTTAAVFRLVGSKIPNPYDLGVPQSVIDLYELKQGLVLVTGPTGSGKSTTLASLIGLINDHLNDHIITLEDPIEYLHRHNKSIVNQREIGVDTRSYAAALRAALREDPDVILVGEMRDLETIATAVTAAETGHLVFSTLHTIGCAETIDRIIDVFPTDQQDQIKVQLSMVLEAVISQRLIPTIDGTGRVAAFEVMLADSAIRNLIREGKNYLIPSNMQSGKQKGMMTMNDSLVDLYNTGRISRKDAILYCTDQDEMSKRLM
ncbi:MAG: type IV pilus twitching motility protein PilT [Clostridia bacterium]|nr:type IV pilus twitching motility protein PilT [Clostridia bacterium]MBR5015469.1 type IV pilus twitching motility protein PilT [Clostridia bacterium]MBR5976798.1 type IV pilus twitching motility protein PilT [Clostridia bacterium]MBR5991502.1 type IV pilus twitching motility protein PilT [Clostridia bacterium]MBR6512990.1 type IV pilus twitching motility protein PilT [Clostridia bacterium]